MDEKNRTVNKTTKIKICGLRRPQDIQAANQYKPDYIGFVFAPASKRFVFVNEDREIIFDLLNKHIISIVQLHGQETEDDICWIKRKTDAQVIKAVSVHEKADIARWENSSADYLLFDHGSGGTGQTFDWSLLTDCCKRYFLAGGIDADNLKTALNQGAYAVDISGGAETDGWKDAEKISQLIRMVRIS